MAVLQRGDHGGSFSVTATHDMASLAAQTGRQETITVAGVLSTDDVVAVPPAGLDAGLVLGGAYVSADNTVEVVVANVTADAIDEASGTWTFLVFRH